MQRISLSPLLFLPLAACSSGPALQEEAFERPAASAESPVADPDAYSVDLEVHFGGRGFDDDDWDDGQSDLADQFTLGIQAALPLTEHFQAEFGFWGSAAEDDVGNTDVTGSVGEVSLGVRALAATGSVRPYVGAGVSFLHGEIERESGGVRTLVDDEAIGLYVHAGVAFAINEILYAGLDLRAVSEAEFDLAGSDLDAGYSQATVFLGFRL